MKEEEKWKLTYMCYSCILYQERGEMKAPGVQSTGPPSYSYSASELLYNQFKLHINHLIHCLPASNTYMSTSEISKTLCRQLITHILSPLPNHRRNNLIKRIITQPRGIVLIKLRMLAPKNLHADAFHILRDGMVNTWQATLIACKLKLLDLNKCRSVDKRLSLKAIGRNVLERVSTSSRNGRFDAARSENHDFQSGTVLCQRVYDQRKQRRHIVPRTI